ncbi:MAG TPA: enoyl-CoA hydratase-related protein [Terriglobales bacterium]|nr:enoyl-CoA hydratase-related protein [Terriglobales bacterium]
MQTLVLVHRPHSSLLTLNRPERRNAISFEMIDEILRALDECWEEQSKTGARSLILTGAGSVFCAGMDIEALRSLSRFGPAQNLSDSQRMSLLFKRLYEFPAPTIAAVNGAAVAGGCGLASVCDFTLAVPEAKFGYTEARIGFIPALVSVYLLRLVGEKRARDLLLSARLISAAEALAWGLIGEIVPADRLLPRAEELAEALMRNSPSSLRATKQLLRDLPVYSLDEALKLAVKANAAIRQTPDYREGLAAFLEKRAPQWNKPQN